MMDFVGKGQPLTRKGLTAGLDKLGLGPGDAAYIWTIVEVETAGMTQGFGFRLDRRPQILFERHKFRGFTGGRFDAEASDISGPAGGYGTFAAQYARLEKAMTLCEKAGLGIEPALKSASWGVGQAMGFNHEVAGFASAADMVEAMKAGEDVQLAAMARFLVANGLADALSRKDWVGFARRYNGRDYWKNKYDIKLAEQYQRFASGSLPSLEVRTAQAALLLLGYSPGKIDGVLGPRTRGALRNFRIAAGLSAGDDLDGQTYEALCQKAGFDR
jgi:N-acetylmuramidase/Putative peptidoglycan binding domain